MSDKIKKTKIQIGGKDGILFHDKLCSDGPVDPVTGEPLIDPETGEPYEGPNDDMADLIHDYMAIVRSSMLLDGKNVSRYGVLSDLAAATPMFVYDHPSLKKLSTTAFTDGIHVFIDADFMRKLVIEEQEYDGQKSGVVFLILHELMHKLFRHTDRMKNVSNHIAQIAQDLVINGKLIKGYPGLSPVPSLLEVGVGMSPAEADKYFSMSEEMVGEMLIQNEQKRKHKPEPNSGGPGQDKEQNKNNDQSQGQTPGGSGVRRGRKRKGDSSGSGQSQDEQPNQELSDILDKALENEDAVVHHVELEDLMEVLEECGLLDTISDALNLPPIDRKEEIEDFKQKQKLNDMDIVQKSIAKALMHGGRYPGQHIAEEASDVILEIGRSKLKWKFGLKNLVAGGSFKSVHSDDEASLLWYLDEDTTGLDAFYEGSLIPAKNNEVVLCIIDTSGSTEYGNMRQEFAQEIIGLQDVNAARDGAAKVVVLSADSIIRGEPIIIDRRNVDKIKNEGLPVFGNGGTDFVRSLDQAVEMPLLKKEKIRSVLYFTDCCDHPPSEEDFKKYLEKGVKVAFFTVPSMYSQSWSNSVKGWADVYSIDEDEKVVDLSVEPKMR